MKSTLGSQDWVESWEKRPFTTAEHMCSSEKFVLHMMYIFLGDPGQLVVVRQSKSDKIGITMIYFVLS